jgi:hypothetical protein
MFYDVGMQANDEQQAPTQLHDKLRPLRTLYPDYTEAELQEAYENLMRYFDRAWKIFVRLRKEGRLHEIFDNLPAASYDEDQRSNPT